MTEPADSKLSPDSKQPELLPVARAPFFEEIESKGEFTGERLWKQRPDTYKAIVVLLGQRMGVIAIGRALEVSPNTVMAVRDREGQAIDIVKTHLASVAHGAATVASELILESLNHFAQMRGHLPVKELKDLAVVYGILVQNGQLLAGQPTARIEVSELQQPDHDDFNRHLAGLKSANPMGWEAEKSAQKGRDFVDLEPARTGPEPSPTKPSPGPEPSRTDLAPGAQATEPTGAKPATADAQSDGKAPKP